MNSSINNIEVIPLNDCFSYTDFQTIRNKKKTLTDMHYELEIGVICSGKMRRSYPEFSVVLEKGQVWLNNMWEPHSFEVMETPCKVFIMGIDPLVLQKVFLGIDLSVDWLAPFMVSPEKRPQLMSKEDKESILQLVNLQEKNLTGNDSLKKPRERLVIVQIILHLLSKWPLYGKSEKSSTANYGRINNALELLFKSKSYISVEEAAKSCAMNISLFNSTFSSFMGISFAKFALNNRLKGAATSLINTDDSMQKIVFDWDFTDLSHFYKSFKRLYNCTPGEYRKLSQKNNLP